MTLKGLVHWPRPRFEMRRVDGSRNVTYAEKPGMIFAPQDGSGELYADKRGNTFVLECFIPWPTNPLTGYITAPGHTPEADRMRILVPEAIASDDFVKGPDLTQVSDENWVYNLKRKQDSP